jgi:hypothetical protein
MSTVATGKQRFVCPVANSRIPISQSVQCAEADREWVSTFEACWWFFYDWIEEVPWLGTVRRRYIFYGQHRHFFYIVLSKAPQHIEGINPLLSVYLTMCDTASDCVWQRMAETQASLVFLEGNPPSCRARLTSRRTDHRSTLCRSKSSCGGYGTGTRDSSGLDTMPYQLH